MRLVNDSETPFYLTGGTALSRVYLNHRFSDDLDFFVNDDPKYADYMRKIRDRLEAESPRAFIWDKDANFFGPNFSRIRLKSSAGTILQLDFVNDIPYRAGSPTAQRGFGLVDTWENILSNKIAALTRYAAKDMADLVFLSRRYRFVWPEVMHHAKQKEGSVDLGECAAILQSVSPDFFSAIPFVQNQDEAKICSDLRAIAQDILYGRKNSLCETD